MIHASRRIGFHLEYEVPAERAFTHIDERRNPVAGARSPTLIRYIQSNSVESQQRLSRGDVVERLRLQRRHDRGNGRDSRYKHG